MKKMYLHVVIDISLETDSILAYRKVLGKFIIAMKNADLDVVVMLHEDQLEKSNSHIHSYKNKCIDSVESMPISIIQL